MVSSIGSIHMCVLFSESIHLVLSTMSGYDCLHSLLSLSLSLEQEPDSNNSRVSVYSNEVPVEHVQKGKKDKRTNSTGQKVVSVQTATVRGSPT